jgi:hypothetical protein
VSGYGDALALERRHVHRPASNDHRAVAVAHTRSAVGQGISAGDTGISVNTDRSNVQLAAHRPLVGVELSCRMCSNCHRPESRVRRQPVKHEASSGSGLWPRRSLWGDLSSVMMRIPLEPGQRVDASKIVRPTIWLRRRWTMIPSSRISLSVARWGDEKPGRAHRLRIVSIHMLVSGKSMSLGTARRTRPTFFFRSIAMAITVCLPGLLTRI